jgi:lambda repressor-like predicted transcriptional regulator
VTKRSFSSSGLPAEFISNQLFAALEAGGAPVDQLTLAKRIKPMLNQRGWSNIAFIRAAGMHLGEFFRPRYARHGAPLKVLLKICHSAGIDLKDLLRKDGPDLSILPVRKPVPEIGKWKNDTYVAALRSALETALAEPCPTALYRIAARFQCEPRQLPQNFPQLCHQIALKRKRFRTRRRQRLINRLANALDAPEPQSSRALARSLGVSYSGLYKAFPKEVMQLSARFRAFQKQSSMARKDAAAALIRGAAYRLHEQGTYPSVRKVLRELDWQRTQKTDELVREVMTSFRRELNNHSKAIVRILDT